MSSKSTVIYSYLRRYLLKIFRSIKPFMHPQFGGIPFVWLFSPHVLPEERLTFTDSGKCPGYVTESSPTESSQYVTEILPTSEEILPPIFQNIPQVLWSQGTPKELYKVLRSHTSTYIKQWCTLCKMELNWN